MADFTKFDQVLASTAPVIQVRFKSISEWHIMTSALMSATECGIYKCPTLTLMSAIPGYSRLVLMSASV